jgi:hypothetical protein
MNLQSARLGSILVALPLSATNAFAHHIMGGRTPATFGDGMLSGLGHPIIGPDHFAAVVAVGCIAAMHSAGALLVVAFIAAMMAGVALHLNGATVPAAEILVALSVIGLGALMLSRRQMSSASAFVLLRWSGSCTVTRWVNRSMAPSKLRFTRICLASRSFKTRLHSPPWRSCAALPDNPRTFRHCDLSARASPVSAWRC